MPEQSRSRFVEYAVTVGLVAVAALLRWLADPVLEDRLPFFTFYFSVIAAAWYGGLKPGILSVLLGILIGCFFFVAPRGSFYFSGVVNQLDVIRFALVGTAISLLSGSLRQARRLAEDKNTALLAHQQQLEHEIQERRRATIDAQEQREKLRITVASIGDGVITTDIEGRATFLNAVAETLTGWKLDDVAGRPLEQVFQIINEASRQPVDNPARRALQQGTIVGLANHTLLIAKDGTERPIDDSAAPIRDDQGRITGCVLVFRDVGERRHIEQHRRTLAAVVECCNDFIGICTPDMKPVYVNEAGMRMVGLDSLDEVKRTNVMDYFWHEDRQHIERAAVPALLRDGHWKGEIRFRHFKTGEAIPTFWNVTVIRDEAGHPIAWATVSPDLRALKNAEAALKHADRRKDEFLAMLAHELRNPLAPVRNSLEIMKRAHGDLTLIEQARNTMDRQITHLQRLVDDLLDISRISQDKLTLRIERVELARVIHQAVETCRPLADLSRHELEITLPAEPITLDADPVRLAQVFSNLLNNACKYTEPGGQIRLVARRDNNDVVVSVKDTGVGIAPEMLPRVFEMFTQVDRAAERSQGGLGIGLTLVRRLAEMHGGTVEAHSDGPGRGSEFVVCLPILAAEPEPGTAAAPDQAAVTRRRILVVDDNRDAAASLSMLLKISGHETHLAHDGLAAVEAVAALHPDVVLLDIGLPKMDGYAAARRIREQPGGADLLLIALTGWGQEEDRRKSSDAGFDAHLVKPVDHVQLLELLSTTASRPLAAPAENACPAVKSPLGTPAAT